MKFKISMMSIAPLIVMLIAKVLLICFLMHTIRYITLFHMIERKRDVLNLRYCHVYKEAVLTVIV